METDCKWGVNFLWIHSRYHFLWQLWHWWTLHNLDLFSYHVFSFSCSKTKMGYRVTPLTHRMSVSYFCFLFFLLLCSFTLLCKMISAQVFKSDQWDGGIFNFEIQEHVLFILYVYYVLLLCWIDRVLFLKLTMKLSENDCFTLFTQTASHCLL